MGSPSPEGSQAGRAQPPRPLEEADLDDEARLEAAFAEAGQDPILALILEAARDVLRERRGDAC